MMTLNEALAEIDRLVRGGSDGPIRKEELECGDTEHAVRIIAEAFEHLRRPDPLYGNRRRLRTLAPPPGSVPPS